MKKILTASALLLSLFTVSGAQAGIVANPGFETPVVAGAVYNPTGASWVFSGFSGIGHGVNAGGFGNTAPPEGQQFAVLQAFNGGQSSFTQTITLAAGQYSLSFLDENRSGYGQSSFFVTLGGLIIGGDSPSNGSFSTFYNVFQTAGGTLALTFTSSTGSSTDTTSFIDNVQISAVPEPASVAMLGLGLIASVGFAARKARRNHA